AGLQQREIANVTSVERRVADNFTRHHSPQRGADRLHLLSRARDLNLYGFGAHSQPDGESTHIAHVQSHILNFGDCESVFLRRDQVAAWLQQQDVEISAVVGKSVSLKSLIQIQYVDANA